MGLCAFAGVLSFALAILTLISAYLPAMDVSDCVQIGGGKGVGTQGHDAHPQSDFAESKSMDLDEESRDK